MRRRIADPNTYLTGGHPLPVSQSVLLYQHCRDVEEILRQFMSNRTGPGWQPWLPASSGALDISQPARATGPPSGPGASSGGAVSGPTCSLPGVNPSLAKASLAPMCQGFPAIQASRGDGSSSPKACVNFPPD